MTGSAVPRVERQHLEALAPVQASEPGALFVFRGNLSLLHADAYIISTDGNGKVEDAWQPLIGTDGAGATRQLADRVDELSSPGHVLLSSTEAEGRAPVLALNVGGIGHGNTIADVMGRLLDALGALEACLAGTAGFRSRPLVALPLIGTGRGGFGDRTGEVIEALLTTVHSYFEERNSARGCDLALACFSDSDYAAVQHCRRLMQPSWVPDGWLDSLVTHAKAGSLGVLFGAGASAGIGLPTWSGLLAELVNRFPDCGLTADQLSSLDHVDAATILIESVGEEQFVDALKDRLSNPPRHSLTHGLISNLGAPLAITTNYDEGYERAVTGRTQHPPTVLPWDTPEPGRPALLKLHGDVGKRKIVLARQDFVAMHAFRRPLAGVLQERLVLGHVLTVGTSMSDATLVHAAEEVRTLIDDARGPEAHPIGTVLLTVPDEGRARLLQGAFTVAFAADEVPAVTEPEAARVRATQEAARRVDILLDWIAMQAADPLGFVLDRRYRRILEGQPRDLAAVRLLSTFARALADDPSAGAGAVGREATAFLQGMGWRQED